MSTVFIHGVPDTAAVWNRLRGQLPVGETVALALPGFGCQRPAGFAATKDAYVDWLIGALEAVPGPRDVVAHDWGSILTMRALALRPDLFRSWVGGGAPYSPNYTWHPTARLWQTPGAGERAMERLTTGLATGMLYKAGLDIADAEETAARIDDTMKAAILSLYRSGADVFSTWAAVRFAVPVPGLVLWGEHDLYADPRYGRDLASAAGSEFVCFAGCGHWWQMERAAESAAAITAYWRRSGL